MNRIRTRITLDRDIDSEVIINEKKLYDKVNSLHYGDYAEYCGDTDEQKKIYCALDYLYGIDMRPDICRVARISEDSNWTVLGKALEKFYWSYMNKKGVTILKNE